MRTLIHVFLTRDKDIKVSDGQYRKSESAQLFFKCLFYLRHFLHNVFSLICAGPRIDTNKRSNSPLISDESLGIHVEISTSL